MSHVAIDKHEHISRLVTAHANKFHSKTFFRNLSISSNEGNLFYLRPCVPVTVSNFGIISRNYTDFRYIPVPVHSGTFSCQPFLSTGVPFQKNENVPEIFAKQAYKNVRNHCLSVSKTTVFLCPKISKISKIWKKFKNTGLKPVI